MVNKNLNVSDNSSKHLLNVDKSAESSGNITLKR